MGHHCQCAAGNDCTYRLRKTYEQGINQDSMAVTGSSFCCKAVLQCTYVDGGCNAVNMCCLACRGPCHALLLSTRAAYLRNVKESITNNIQSKAVPGRSTSLEDRVFYQKTLSIRYYLNIRLTILPLIFVDYSQDFRLTTRAVCR
jgi:hypothetical protein